MKSKIFTIICLLGFSVLFFSRDYSSAQSRSVSSKIGIVNIEKVSTNCKATENFMKIIKAERDKMDEQEDGLYQKMLALQKELDSGALKFGSDTYIARQRELAKTQSDLQYYRDFNKSEQAFKSQIWKMELYKKILRISDDLGDEKSLDLILAVNEPDLTEQRLEDLGLIVSTHKVLYSSGCLDLTSAVIAKMDEETQAGN